MATIGVTECPICHEEITDPTLHFRTCKGAEGTSPVPESSDSKTETMATTAKTAQVKFSWVSLTRFTSQSVTLLSAFQSIELYLERQSTSTSEFLSKTVDVPIGEYDGQLVVGGSYCYPVRKFLIEQDGDVIPLELDVSKYDQNQDIDDEASAGTYGQYVTAYTTSPSTTGDPVMQYNPAYSDAYSSSYGYGKEGGVPTKRVLMIFAPTDEESMYQQGDVVYAKKNKQGQLQIMPNSTAPDPALGEEFSQQLSEEGFTPATVKSKKGSSTPATGKTYARYTTDPSMGYSHTVGTTHPATMATSHTSRSNVEERSSTRKSNGRFSVSEIQEGSSHVTREEHNRVCEEKDQLKKDHLRVKAQLEGKVKRLEKKLGNYEANPEADTHSDSDDVIIELEETRGGLTDTKRDLIERDKELMEAKDRMTALENQIEEYAGTIDDQSRVIHNYTHHGGGDRQYTKLQELYAELTEFTKKQQLEFHIQLENFQKKMEGAIKFQEENIVLQEACEKMTADITEYRTQTKLLLKDIETKRKETMALKEELLKGSDRQGRRNPSEMESLELETLHQKCDGWRELAERASEEVEVLRIQVQQLEQERDSLNQELQGLVEKLQCSLSDKEVGQSKVTDLQRQVSKLQDTRISMEEEMSRLRSEKTRIVERNAHLVEACDPNEIGKVKQKLQHVLEEKEVLESELKGVQIALDMHQQKNLDLKEQLEKTSNPQVLTQIQEKLKRYRQERDSAKKQLSLLREEIELTHGEEIGTLKQTIEELKGKKRKYREGVRQYEEVNHDLVVQMKEKDEMIAFLQSIHGNGDEEEDGHYGDVYSDEDVGVSNPSHHYPLHRGGVSSSVQSLPVSSEPRQRSRSGVITTTNIDHTHQRSSHTSLIETRKMGKSNIGTGRSVIGTTPSQYTPSSSQYTPSLNTDDTLLPVQIRTNKGLRETYVQKLDQDALQENIRVIVQRKEGVYEMGVVKYFGNPNSKDRAIVIGVQLDLQRSDPPGNTNDGTYKDGKRYFCCPKGYGLFVYLSKLFIEIDVS